MKKKVLLSFIFVLITTLLLFSTSAFADWPNPICEETGGVHSSISIVWYNNDSHRLYCNDCGEYSNPDPHQKGSTYVTSATYHQIKCTTCGGPAEPGITHKFNSSWKCVCGRELTCTVGSHSLLPVNSYETTEILVIA